MPRDTDPDENLEVILRARCTQAMKDDVIAYGRRNGNMAEATIIRLAIAKLIEQERQERRASQVEEFHPPAPKPQSLNDAPAPPRNKRTVKTSRPHKH